MPTDQKASLTAPLTLAQRRGGEIIVLRRHIIEHLGCQNCNAKPGEPCLHDYGCTDLDRTKK